MEGHNDDEDKCDACGKEWKGDEGSCIVTLMPVDGGESIPDFWICSDCEEVQWIDDNTLLYNEIECYVAYC